MIRNMNQMSKSWVMRGFFAILIAAFVLIWGVSDVFQGGGLSDHNVATVGDVKISASEFMHQVKIASAKLQQSGQTVPEANIQQQVLGMLYRNALMDQEADQLGLAISDAQVSETIKSAAVFRDQNGNFSKQIFEGYARMEGLSVKAFEDSLRQDMRRAQLMSVVAGNIPLPDSYVKTLFRWMKQKRTVDYALVIPASFTNLPAPSDEQLQKYYDEHHDQFTRPETRDVTVLLISEKSLRPKIKLTQEEIQEGLTRKREQNQASQGKLPSKAETDAMTKELENEKAIDEFNRLTAAIEDAMAGGKSLEDMSQDHGLQLVKVEALARSGMSKVKPAFSNEILIETAEQAFKQEKGEAPILSQLGDGEYIAIRVDEIHAATLPTLEEIKKDVAMVLNNEAQHNATKELATAIMEKVNAGGQLDQLAKEHKLDVKKGVSIERQEKKDKSVPLSIISAGFTTDLNKASLAPAEKGSLAVVVPRTISEPKAEELNADELKTFRTNIENQLINDLQGEYLQALQNRYRIEQNKAILTQLTKPQK